MNKYMALVVPVFLLTGCPPTETGCDTATGAGCDTESGGNTDDTEPVFDPANDITLTWTAGDGSGSMTLDIVNSGANGVWLGMAETAAGGAGWYGEDCLFNDCHHFTGTPGGTLDYVHVPNDVVPGGSTLFNDGTDGYGDVYTSSGADRLTYLVQLEGGALDAVCYVWGDDPSYYAGEGCTNL